MGIVKVSQIRNKSLKKANYTAREVVHVCHHSLEEFEACLGYIWGGVDGLYLPLKVLI